MIFIKGLWINHTKKENNAIAFNAKAGDSRRFACVPGKPNTFYDGRWETTFSPNTADSSKAIGLFSHQNGSAYVNGTFLKSFKAGYVANGFMFSE